MATAVAENKPVHPIVTLQKQFETRANELQRALPAHVPVERFTRVVMTAAQLNADLLTCDRQSLWNACMRAAQDGLLPDGREAALVPYRTKQKDGSYKDIVQYLPMIQGLLKRFRNSGQFKAITADVVREGEEFSYWKDENGEHMRHVPGDGDGKIIKTYAVATTKDGGTMIRVMSTADIEKRRAVSRAKDGPMWSTWWEEAAMKTVLRNLSKRLPMSSDLDDLIRRDDELYDFDNAAANRPRLTDVGAALDHFSGGSPTSDSNPAPTSEPTLASSPTESSAPTDESSDPELTKAFNAGAAAKRSGMARKAVPPEYRTPEASHLAKNWWAGWDSV